MRADELIQEAYARAEKLSNDEEQGEYYKQCFEAGDPFIDNDWDDDEEDDYAKGLEWLEKAKESGYTDEYIDETIAGLKELVGN